MAKSSLLSHRHSHIIIILLAVLVGFAGAAVVLYSPKAQQQITPPVSAQGLADLENAFVAVAEKARPAVVNITAERVAEGRRSFRVIPDDELRKFFDQFRRRFGEPPESKPREEGEEEQSPFKTQSLGSGWIYGEDGYIVTNTHVVKGGTNLKVQLFDKKGDDRNYPAKLVGTDPKTDLAVLKIDAPRKLPTLKLGSSEDAKVGQWVMAVGTPFALDQTVTVGVISAKGRTLRDPRTPYIRLGDIIQTDAAINRGNSGGPLLNLRGEVIGINVAIYTPGMVAGNVGIGFAIPSDTAKRIVPQLIEYKIVKRGWLGISIDDLTHNKKDFYGVDHGALVTMIHEDSPAAKGGLQVEDVIVEVDGEPIEDTWELQETIGNSPPGATITLKVIRNKREESVELKLGEMPARYAGLEKPEEPEKEEVEKASGALRVTVRSVTAEDKAEFDDADLTGVVVAKVHRDSPAAAKLAVGDVVTKLNQTPVENLDDWETAVEEAKKGGQPYIVLRLSRKLGDEVVQTIVDIDVDW